MQLGVRVTLVVVVQKQLFVQHVALQQGLWGLHEGRQKLRRNEPRAHGSNGGGAEDGDCGVGKRRDLGEVKERRAGGAHGDFPDGGHQLGHGHGGSQAVHLANGQEEGGLRAGPVARPKHCHRRVGVGGRELEEVVHDPAGAAAQARHGARRHALLAGGARRLRVAAAAGARIGHGVHDAQCPVRRTQYRVQEGPQGHGAGMELENHRVVREEGRQVLVLVPCEKPPAHRHAGGQTR